MVNQTNRYSTKNKNSFILPMYRKSITFYYIAFDAGVMHFNGLSKNKNKR